MARSTLAVGAVGVAVVAAAVWFAAGWIADPPDGTCGSVFRPEIWWQRHGCATEMSVRAVASAGLAALGIGVVVFAARSRIRVAPRIALIATVAATIALLVNEATRDGGLG
jgi:hypothetical protein